MSVIEIIGWSLIASPFVLIFCFIAKTEGLTVAAGCYSVTACLFGVLFLGFKLAGID